MAEEKQQAVEGEVATVAEDDAPAALEEDVARRLRHAESQLVAQVDGSGSMLGLQTKKAIEDAVGRALARIEAVKAIKAAALTATNKRDWVAHGESDGQDTSPYLQESGCEKLMHMFGVEPNGLTCTKELHPEDDTYEYVFGGQVRALILSPLWYPIVGSRWSGDGFFTRGGKIRPDPGDVRKASLTNWFNRAIKTVLGLRNITWEDLERHAGIKRSDVPVVTFEGGKHKGGDRTATGTSKALADGPHLKVFIDYTDKTSQGTIKGLPQDERTFDGSSDPKCWLVKATKHNVGLVRDLVATGRGVKYTAANITEEQLEKL